MTATPQDDLPPLPVACYVLAWPEDQYESDIYITSMDGYSDEHMKSYAKLAVRVALERAVIMLDESEGDIDLLRFKLERLLKEYE